MQIKIYSLFLLLCFGVVLSAQPSSLDDYLEAGLKNSPVLKDYQFQMSQNGIDSMRIKATFKPQVNLNSQFYYAPTIKGYGYDIAVTNGGTYSAQLSVSQPLIMRKSKQAQLEDLNIQNRYADNASKITQLDLKKAITSQYISAYNDLIAVQSAEEVSTLLNTEKALLRPLIERGIYPQTDFLNLRMAVEKQLLNQRQARRQYTTDLYSLNILCGLSDTSFSLLKAPSISLAPSFDLSHSVLLMQYHIDSLQFMNRRKIIDVGYLPKLSAFADAGLLTSNVPIAYKNFGAGIGLNFSMPIYDGHQRKFEYSKLQLAAEISHNYQIYYQSRYRQEIQQLENRLQSADELISDTQKQMELAQGLIDIYKAQLEKGIAKITDLVLAVNNYFSFKTSLQQMQMERLQIINELNYFK